MHSQPLCETHQHANNGKDNENTNKHTTEIQCTTQIDEQYTVRTVNHYAKHTNMQTKIKDTETKQTQTKETQTDTQQIDCKVTNR